MNGIDIIILVVAGAFCIKGYIRGFVNELFGFFIFAASAALSFYLFRPIGEALSLVIENKDLSLIVSFAGIFILVAVLLIAVRNAIRSVVEHVNFTDADTVLGSAFGLFKGVLLCGIVLMVLRNRSFPGLENAIRASLVFPYVARGVGAVVSLLPGSLESFAGRLLGT